MLIDNTDLYDKVWDKVYKELHFKPDISYTHSFNSNVPFKIDDDYAVFNVEKMDDGAIDKMDSIIKNIFIDVTKEDERIYALDWQHSAFLYNPRNEDEQKFIKAEDTEFFNGEGYNAYFPEFFPDGDYYFFIDENFRFGYLGHPWRQEVWIFGKLLLDKFEQVYKELGWIKLK